MVDHSLLDTGLQQPVIYAVLVVLVSQNERGFIAIGYVEVLTLSGVRNSTLAVVLERNIGASVASRNDRAHVINCGQTTIMESRFPGLTLSSAACNGGW